ncbi:hypothetical protein [Vibrio pomeroyi]|uniref:hypothetical protein n=1 Tax=Vibrio pomeroyi TaxID=198832 RepID=UPI0021C46581|nr:hypothetical protein [Vibrio pomeroyi]
MIEKNVLFLTIPFVALLVGFIFTFIKVWYKKSEKEADESRITEELVTQLRAQKKEHTQGTAESDKELKQSFEDLLAQQTLANEKLWKEKEDRIKLMLSGLAKTDIHTHSRDPFLSVSAFPSYLSETKAAMQILSLQTQPQPQPQPLYFYGAASNVRRVKRPNRNVKYSALKENQFPTG